MFPVIEFPELVQHYAPFFKEVFSEEAFVQFERYISGLLVSENKTVEVINRLVLYESRNQSSLNRLLTESPFSIAVLNQARLAVMESLPETRMKPYGVLGVDDTLLAHYGQHFDQIAYLYDHVEQRYVWAHNLVTWHYSDDQTDYPVVFQLWKPVDLDKLEAGLVAAKIVLKDSKQALKKTTPYKWRQYLIGVWRRNQKNPEVAKLYDSKLEIAERLLDAWIKAHPDPKLPVTFDAWYTQPDFCKRLTQKKLAYVGTLSDDDHVILSDGTQERLDVFAKHLKQEHFLNVQENLSGKVN